MGKFISYLLSQLGSFVANGLIDILYALIAMAEFAVCAYTSYYWIYEPIAASPGARDGTGLLFVMLFVLAGTMVMTIFLTSITKRVLNGLFPWWRPTLFEE